MSKVHTGGIEASVTLTDKRRAPSAITLRLPHPDGRKAVAAKGGRYDPLTGTVGIEPFRGKADVRLSF